MPSDTCTPVDFYKQPWDTLLHIESIKMFLGYRSVLAILRAYMPKECFNLPKANIRTVYHH